MGECFGVTGGARFIFISYYYLESILVYFINDQKSVLKLLNCMLITPVATQCNQLVLCCKHLFHRTYIGVRKKSP